MLRNGVLVSGAILTALPFCAHLVLLGYQAGDMNGDGVVDQKDVNIFNSTGNCNNGWYP